MQWSSSAWRPFCSERCKLIDLGAWGSDQRAIPVTAPADRQLDNGEPDDDRSS